MLHTEKTKVSSTLLTIMNPRPILGLHIFYDSTGK